MKTFIIAEAGANHNKSFKQAKKLIDIAIKAKADAIKFQLYTSNSLYSKYTPNFSNYENIPELIKKIEFPSNWHNDLKKYCDDNDIEFMSTGFGLKEIDELYNLGVKRLKIASFEAGDPRIIKHASQTKLPLIISVGAGMRGHNIGINDVISWVKEENPNPDITFLHCNSAYPTPPEDVHLNQIKFYKKELSKIDSTFKVGFSDHTMSTIIPAFSLFFGAEVIEKHFTLNRKSIGPDHPFSLEPNELKEMVCNIRLVEQILSSSFENELTKSEKENEMIKATRSVVAKRQINKGDVLNENNITTKRPFLNGAIPAHLFYEIIGKISLKDIKEDELVMFENI